MNEAQVQAPEPREKTHISTVLNGIFYLPTNEVAFFPQDFDVNEFWRAITFKNNFNPNSSTVFMIWNLMLRILQMMMSNTLLGK